MAVRSGGQRSGRHHRLAQQDVAVTLDIIPGVPHVFQAYQGMLEEGAWALDRAGEFVPLPFDEAGDLDQEALFPESVRGRRGRAAEGRSHAHAGPHRVGDTRGS